MSLYRLAVASSQPKERTQNNMAQKHDLIFVAEGFTVVICMDKVTKRLKIFKKSSSEDIQFNIFLKTFGFMPNWLRKCTCINDANTEVIHNDYTKRLVEWKFTQEAVQSLYGTAYKRVRGYAPLQRVYNSLTYEQCIEIESSEEEYLSHIKGFVENYNNRNKMRKGT